MIKYCLIKCHGFYLLVLMLSSMSSIISSLIHFILCALSYFFFFIGSMIGSSFKSSRQITLYHVSDVIFKVALFLCNFLLNLFRFMIFLSFVEACFFVALIFCLSCLNASLMLHLDDISLFFYLILHFFHTVSLNLN